MPFIFSERAKVWAAFSAIYLIWGTTFLAMSYSVAAIPPFMVGGIRFVAAGLLLGLPSVLAQPSRLRQVPWGPSAIVGGLLFSVGNGAIAWAQQYLPSGVAAVVVSAVPIWLVLLDGQQRRQLFKKPLLLGGLLAGCLGVAFLSRPSNLAKLLTTDRPDLAMIGVGAMLVSTLAWAVGSLYARTIRYENTPPALRSAAQMLAGGLGLSIASLVQGEWRQFDPGQLPWQPVVAMTYLVLMGSLIGFSAYSYLMRVRPPAQVGTYAYVNPVVAIAVVGFMGKEVVTWQLVLSLAIILAGVFMIYWAGKRR
jgi:drug/metabolite transporter (DMT)-like permease